jgi:lipoprotein-anchoring transpeptidase ErfK/SrfK
VSRHRAEARPRWGRIGLTASAAAVVVLALLAGFGVLTPGSDSKQIATDAGLHVAAKSSASDSASAGPSTGESAGPVAGSAAGSAASAPASASASGSAAGSAAGTSATEKTADETALPDGSGTGRRAVFDQSMQRVWIVDGSGQVQRTYPVSGSDENNLRPGTYQVYSKSRWAVGIDDSGVMQYFVRFAHGTDNGAAIGFHSIPTKNGKPLQTVAQLGERLSHGCIRQKTADAIAMWDFAGVGTKVVVVA